MVLEEYPFKGSNINKGSNSINQFCAVQLLDKKKKVLFMKRVNLCEAKDFRIDSPCFVFIMIKSQGASNRWWFSPSISVLNAVVNLLREIKHLKTTFVSSQ